MPSTAAQGQLYIVPATSGAGKTSLLKALLDRDADICVTTSNNTRDKRQGEKDGKDQHFVSHTKNSTCYRRMYSQ